MRTQVKPQLVLHRKFSRLLSMAETNLREGRHESAAALCQLAAHLAYPANVGLYASPRLERLLRSIGSRLIDHGAQPAAVARDGDHHVLHILTYARPVGGDSRYAWRWIGADTSRIHTVVLTSQFEIGDSVSIPPDFRQATAARGGTVVSLGSGSRQLTARALELRRIAQAADVIVIHAFPYDVVPILALAEGCGHAKTLLINHSDHTFWVGSVVSDLIVNLRRQEPEFQQFARHLRADRQAMLPIPLPDLTAPMDRNRARRELGLLEGHVLLLTVASKFKYSCPNAQGFLDLVLPLVRRAPNVILIAIGPEAVGEWAEAQTLTDGRMRALGMRHDTAVFYAAADIYLDSVPFSSMTSLLEAGSHALPLVCLRPPPGLRLLGPGAPGLDDTAIQESSPLSYQARLGELIDDADLRHTLGQSTRDQIVRHHWTQGWRIQLESLYAACSKADEHGCLASQATDSPTAESLGSILYELYGQTRDRLFVSRLILNYTRPLDPVCRLLLRVQLCLRGFAVHALLGLFLWPAMSVRRRLAALRNRAPQVKLGAIRDDAPRA